LNGYWLGNKEIVKRGKCSFKEGSTNKKSLFKIDFSDTNDIKIIEYAQDSNSKKFLESRFQDNWRGVTIKNDSTYCFLKTFNVYCEGSPQTNITFDSEEEWCPSMKCKFYVKYKLIKTTDTNFDFLLPINEELILDLEEFENKKNLTWPEKKEIVLPNK